MEFRSISLGFHIRSQIDTMPSRPGIYKFLDKNGIVIYVGKAKNIKKRILGHFYSSSDKECQLCHKTFALDYELMGSELLSLLREADLIQKYDPVYNYIQKKEHTIYHMVHQKNSSGILHLNIERKSFKHILSEYYFKRGNALKRLRELCERFQLCPKFSGLQNGKGKCTQWKFHDCKGICQGKEDIGSYNNRVLQALNYLKTESDDYVIFEKGRHGEERSFVLVLQGVYQGYGFLDVMHSISGIDDLLDLMEPKKNTFHTAQIISSYAKRNQEKLKRFKSISY